MNKVILINKRPEQVVNILNGDATRILSKSIPKLFKGWVYIAVTNSGPHLGRNENYGWQHKNRFSYALYNVPHFGDLKLNDGIGDLNGLVVARFWYDEFSVFTPAENGYEIRPLIAPQELCLTKSEINAYGNNYMLYTWKIKQLEIFDEPKRIQEFKVLTKYLVLKNGELVQDFITLFSPPSTWQYVYIKENENNEK